MVHSTGSLEKREGGVWREVMECGKRTAREESEAHGRSLIQWKDNQRHRTFPPHHRSHAQEPSILGETH